MNAKAPLGRPRGRPKRPSKAKTLAATESTVSEDNTSEQESEDQEDDTSEEDNTDDEVESVEPKKPSRPPPKRPDHRRRLGVETQEKRPNRPPGKASSALFDIAKEEQRMKRPSRPAPQSNTTQQRPSGKGKKPSLMDIAADISDDSADDEEQTTTGTVHARRPDLPKRSIDSVSVSPRSKKATNKLATIAREIDEEEGTFDTAVTDPIVPSKPLGRNRHGKRPTSQAVELSADADRLSAKFIRAAYKGNVRKVHKYIRDGVDVNASDRHGWTALHWAVSISKSILINNVLS